MHCWIAPRDLGTATSWAEAVLPAIQAGRVLVLLFSATSNASPQVVREVEAAAKSGLAIVALRVDPIVPSREIGPLLSTARWIDAFTPPLAGHLQRLGRTIQQLLEPKAFLEPEPAVPLEEPLDTGGTRPGRRWPVVAAVVLVLGLLGAWAALGGRTQGGQSIDRSASGRATPPATAPSAGHAAAPRPRLFAPVPPWAMVSPAQIEEAFRLQLSVAYRHDQTHMRFVLVPGGTFTMGSPDSELGRYDDEGPQHEVTISPFYLAITETTNAQFRRFKAEHDSGTGLDGADQPVVQVSHGEASAFAAWLAERGVLPGARLPTEAEWEYACRAGTTTCFSFGDMLSTDQANYDGSRGSQGGSPGWYRGKTLPVGRLGHNPWGLYDMHGNAWEWCSDWMAPYSALAQRDPQGPASGGSRVLRGGSWLADPWNVRAAFRAGLAPGDRYDRIGFRLALPVSAR